MLVEKKQKVHRGVAQPGSALGSGPRGRRFKSYRPDCHYNYFKLVIGTVPIHR